MYYSVILQYGSNIAVRIPGYCYSVDEKLLSFKNIWYAKNLTNLLFFHVEATIQL